MNNKIKTGSIIIGVVLLVVISFFIANIYSLHFNYYRIIIELEKGNNVAAGNGVSFLGVRVGTVEKVAIRNTMVAATLKIRKEINIPKESVFKIENIGLFGEKHISIYPSGKIEYYKNNDIIKGEDNSSNASELLKTVGIVTTTMHAIEINNKLDSIITLLNNQKANKSIK